MALLATAPGAFVGLATIDSLVGVVGVVALLATTFVSKGR